MSMIVNDRNTVGENLSTVIVRAIEKKMKDDPMAVMLEADLGGASGTLEIRNTRVEQFVECGIAEANMIGVAAGMSLLGFKPFVHSFASFISRRAFDQIYVSGGYAQTTINIYASDPGFASTHNGGTHTTFEDVAILNTVPNCIISDPADAVAAEWMVNAFFEEKGVHYMRCSRKAVRNIYKPGSKFSIGHGNILKQGSEILIIGAGELISEALDAADILDQKGWSTEVIDPVTIKPFDDKLLLHEASGKKAVLTIENASVYGGLGSIVNSLYFTHGISMKVHNFGVKDKFGEIGDKEYLKKQFCLTAQDLVACAESLMMRREQA